MALLVRLRSQRLSFSSQAISAGCVLRSVFVRLGKCYSSRLGEVLSAEQIQTAAQQLLQAVESEGFTGSAALSQALETCESIKSVQESRAA